MASDKGGSVIDSVKVNKGAGLRRTNGRRVPVALACAGATLGLVLVVGLGACAQDVANEPPDVEWTAPAWFAEQAQAREEERLGYQRCMDAKGWDRTMMEGGGSVEPFVAEDADDRSEIGRFDEDVEACRVELGLPEPHEMTADELAVQYDAELDIARCLEHLGFEISEPPSRQAWIDRMLAANHDPSTAGDLWAPHNELAERAVAGEQDIERRLDEAQAQCPQYWVP
ncbi:hypothetical protein [Cellulomonas sp. A375-1]|uniref:hypothetical protein n=1 Tax=Cellulomonas sp. A375-1 TaxID=1672219 RepID=UPI001E449F34|nr:hypothetical protein [Cellulomonas sp. A375-1]